MMSNTTRERDSVCFASQAAALCPPLSANNTPPGFTRMRQVHDALTLLQLALWIVILGAYLSNVGQPIAPVQLH